MLDDADEDCLIIPVWKRMTNFNRPHIKGSISLHVAVALGCDKMLDVLLACPSAIDLNHRNNDGKTPLLAAVQLQQPDAFIMRLLEAGSDVNIPNNTKMSPLHLAVLYNSRTIALELIKKGADIDAEDLENCTPLYYAVKNNNLELVCMLLYYGADVNILCRRNFSPFTYALYRNASDISEMLVDYYDEFPCTNIYGYNALHLAAWRKSPIALTLVTLGVDVNCVTNYGESSLAFSLEYCSATLFKLIWARLDHRILLNSRKPFLLSYIKQLYLPSPDWVECLYLILQSSNAPDLVELCRNYFDLGTSPEYGFFWELLFAFHVLKVELKDRLGLIYTLLSLGAEVNIHDINIAYQMYGFNEELEAFIYCGNYHRSTCKLDAKYMFPVTTFILAEEMHYGLVEVWRLFKNRTEYRYCIPGFETAHNDIADSLEFFSFSHYIKESILLSSYKAALYSLALEVLPSFPSLVELSRNQARKFLRQNYEINRPYEFHCIVKNLFLPKRIQDIILFKMPVYKS